MRYAFQLGVYWDIRSESLVELAQVAHRALRELVVAAPALEGWRGEVCETSHDSVDDVDGVKQILASGRHEYGIGDLRGTGYHAEFVSNGDTNIVCTMNIGLTVAFEELGPQNSVEVTIPATRALRSDGETILRAMLCALADATKPRWGWVVDLRRGIAFPERAILQDGCPRVGWMTYLSRELGSLPHLRPPHRVTAAPHGHILVAKNQPWDRDDEDHRGCVTSLKTELGAWGVLKPHRVGAVDAPRASDSR